MGECDFDLIDTYSSSTISLNMSVSKPVNTHCTHRLCGLAEMMKLQVHVLETLCEDRGKQISSQQEQIESLDKQVTDLRAIITTQHDVSLVIHL